MDESDEIIMTSKHLSGNIPITTDSDAVQWQQSFEKTIESSAEHLVSVKSLNNSTHVFFLLTWDDSTRGTFDSGIDGTKIIFEVPIVSKNKNEENHEENGIEESKQEVIWQWSTSNNESQSNDVIIKSQWDGKRWHVLFGRTISNSDELDFKAGIKKEGFIKLVVWDGAKGESEKLISDSLPHADFVMLPEIDTYPKDVFVWSSLLAIGTVSFLFVEKKLYRNGADLDDSR